MSIEGIKPPASTIDSIPSDPTVAALCDAVGGAVDSVAVENLPKVGDRFSVTKLLCLTTQSDHEKGDLKVSTLTAPWGLHPEWNSQTVLVAQDTVLVVDAYSGGRGNFVCRLEGRNIAFEIPKSDMPKLLASLCRVN